jgi:hypothetical protein
MSNCSPTLSFFAGAEKRPTVGSLVEASVPGCAGTFRVIKNPLRNKGIETREGHVWLRETGLGIPVGFMPFVTEWPIDELRVVEQA